MCVDSLSILQDTSRYVDANDAPTPAMGMSASGGNTVYGSQPYGTTPDDTKSATISLSATAPGPATADVLDAPSATLSAGQPAAGPVAAAAGPVAGAASPAAAPTNAVVASRSYGTTSFHVDLLPSPGVQTDARGVVVINANPQESRYVPFS